MNKKHECQPHDLMELDLSHLEQIAKITANMRDLNENADMTHTLKLRRIIELTYLLDGILVGAGLDVNLPSYSLDHMLQNPEYEVHSSKYKQSSESEYDYILSQLKLEYELTEDEIHKLFVHITGDKTTAAYFGRMTRLHLFQVLEVIDTWDDEGILDEKLNLILEPSDTFDSSHLQMESIQDKPINVAEEDPKDIEEMIRKA